MFMPTGRLALLVAFHGSESKGAIRRLCLLGLPFWGVLKAHKFIGLTYLRQGAVAVRLMPPPP